MYMSAGFGVCVDILHVIGDTLFNIDKPPNRPNLGPPDNSKSKDEILLENKEFYKQNDFTELENLSKNLESTSILKSTNLENKDFDSSESEIEMIDDSYSQDVEIFDPVQEMDKLLEYCFLKACKTSLKKGELPIITSTFFKNHVISACPAGSTVDIKKSSFKKLSVFLAKMKEKGLIDTSVLRGVESLLFVKV